MDKFLNEVRFEFRSDNGSLFQAPRSDFVGGVTVFVPALSTDAQKMEDAAQMAAWHWANIVPQLNGFNGPGKFNVIPVIAGNRVPTSMVLTEPLMEFFTLDSLQKLLPSASTLAIRVHNALETDLRWRNENEAPSISTVGEFLRNLSRSQLLRTPKLGEKGVDLIARRLEEAGLQLKEE